MEYLSACSGYSTNLPGSTCKMVFTLSKNVLARFSSPFAALTLNTFVDSTGFELAIISGGEFLNPLVEAKVEDLPVNNSYTSGGFCSLALSMKGFAGSAVICGR